MRAGSRTVVVHVHRKDVAAGNPPVVFGGPRFGLIVSKQVGNATVRHAVSRKLRVVLHGSVDTLKREDDVVVRALPAAAYATSAELARDYRSALRKAQKKAAGG